MIDLPDFRPLRITQSGDRVTRKQIDALDQLLVAVPKNATAAVFRGMPKAAAFERLLSRSKKADGKPRTSHLDNPRGTAITVAGMALEDRYETLTRARALVAESARLETRKLGALTLGFDSKTRDAALSALIRAADAAAFRLPSYKTADQTGASQPQSLRLLEMHPRLSLAQTRVGNLGNNIARWLTGLPPNKLSAASYLHIAQALAARYGMKCEFLDTGKLERLGAGAFLAVAQGNAHNEAGIIRLSYRPSRARKPALALVGKGVLFDTGGTNLKPFKSMLDMHTDMQGSAVALGTAVELAAAGAAFAFDAWLAVTENRISATAYKSQDIVVAVNGTSIQVIHTDAEGRMVLADTLALAAEKKPALIIDYATLTGACIVALTTRYSGIFSNRRGAARSLLAAGTASGERVWPFPLDDDFEEPLKSQIADVRQCVIEGAGDHIFAARFLQRFVPNDIAWVHLDLSAGQHKGGLGAVPTDITGFGVAYTLELLADKGPAALAESWN